LSYIGKRRLRRKSYSAARRLSSERAFEGLLLASRRPLRALWLPFGEGSTDAKLGGARRELRLAPRETPTMFPR